MNWLPIETYDALKKKTELAAFRFIASTNSNRRNYLPTLRKR